jgi:hypothetical protein
VRRRAAANVLVCLNTRPARRRCAAFVIAPDPGSLAGRGMSGCLRESRTSTKTRACCTFV